MSPTAESTSFHNVALPITAVVAVEPTAAKVETTSPYTRVADLLERMRSGDREAAAEFLSEYGQRIRRRIRGKLGASMRRLFDSLDILSTLGRRLDLYVMSGRLTAASEAQLWSLVFQMADHAMIDKARLYRRLQHTEGEDSEFARDMVNRLRKAELEQSSGAELEIDRVIRQMANSVDRRILTLWLSGESLTMIGQMLHLSAGAVRKRWELIKAELREQFVALS